MSASLIGRLGSSAFRLSSHSSVDVACGVWTLNQLFDKVLAISGVAEILKPTIDTLRAKLTTLTAAHCKCLLLTQSGHKP